jgi:hypothetical protein
MVSICGSFFVGRKEGAVEDVMDFPGGLVI